MDSNIPKILSAIIDKLLAKQPADRYQSAIGLKYDLTQCARLYREGKISLHNSSLISHSLTPLKGTYKHCVNLKLHREISVIFSPFRASSMGVEMRRNKSYRLLSVQFMIEVERKL